MQTSAVSQSGLAKRFESIQVAKKRSMLFKCSGRIRLDEVKYKINLCRFAFFGQLNVDKVTCSIDLHFKGARVQGNGYTSAGQSHNSKEVGDLH